MLCFREDFGGHAGKADHRSAQRVSLLLAEVKGQAQQRAWGGRALTS